MKTYVAYYRVSTKKQGASGLGLDAQRNAVQSFTKCDTCIVGEYTEVESGKHDSREQLHAAIAHAKQAGATLVIAKLDRLSRNVAFIFTLRDSGCDFVCCDLPDANTLTIGVFAAFAQHEREVISKRTKEALAAKKARGEELGQNGKVYFTNETRKLGVIVNAANAKARNKAAAEHARLLRDKGLSYREIAERLNDNPKNFKTAKEKKFQATTVMRLLK